MRRTQTRLADLEAAFPPGPPLDIEAAREFIEIVMRAFAKVWKTIPQKYQDIILADPDGQLADAVWERARELAMGNILPQAMPGPICQAILDHGDSLRWYWECEDCRANIPVKIFESCPFCGGGVGYAASWHKHRTPALTLAEAYNGKFHRFYELETAARTVIAEMGNDWLGAEIDELGVI